MQLRLKEFAILGIALAIVLKLFTFGMNLPPNFRIIGDAYTYLVIADKLDSFSAVFAYAGDRTVGFPFFEFMVRKAIGTTINLRTWVDAVCAVLLTTHLVTAWSFCAWARRSNLIKSKNATLFLFFFLAACRTYP